MGASVKSQYLQTLVVLKSSNFVASKAPAYHGKDDMTISSKRDEDLKNTAFP
jgi:hypothetical protein